MTKLELNIICLEEVTPPHKSPRFGSHIVYVSDKARDERLRIRNLISGCFAEHTLNGVGVAYFFGIKIPSSFSKKKREQALNDDILPTKRPDNSNLLYFLDNRLEGLAIENDAQIVDTFARKRYSICPFTMLCVWRIKDFYKLPVQNAVWLEAEKLRQEEDLPFQESMVWQIVINKD